MLRGTCSVEEEWVVQVSKDQREENVGLGRLGGRPRQAREPITHCQVGLRACDRAGPFGLLSPPSPSRSEPSLASGTASSLPSYAGALARPRTADHRHLGFSPMINSGFY